MDINSLTPDVLRYIIEALRGGGTTSFHNGELTDQQYGPSQGAQPGVPAGTGMPKGLRGGQIEDALSQLGE